MAGPQASKPDDFAGLVRRTRTLLGAWRVIEANARTSQQTRTKEAAKKFGADLPGNLRRMQDRLRRGYTFSPVFGATPPKGLGKEGKRPIAVASLEDRVVQRAILDVLQQSSGLHRISAVLATPTSVGGLPGRGVDTAIQLFQRCVEDGCTHVAGSDIKDFFNRIPKSDVVGFVKSEIDDPQFTTLLEGALQVELGNAATMPPEDRKLFPTGDDGVAQGCPLSALAGNIVLHDFDRAMNDPSRGLVCIRYIDDFIVVGRSARSVKKGMDAARGILRDLRMDAYDPVDAPAKAFVGRIGDRLYFLGHELSPGRYPPNAASQEKLKQTINALIRDGQGTIRKALEGRPIKPWDKGFAATIIAIHYATRGWRGTYRSSSCPEVFAELDRWVLRRVRDFERYYQAQTSSVPPARRLMALGVAPMDPPSGS